MNKVNVFSEFGKLKTVVVHRPGKELENLTPDLLERLLFDDIPFLETAIEEHDEFTSIMKKHGVEVLYIEELTAEALDAQTKISKEQFINQFLLEGKVEDKIKPLVFNFLSNMKTLDMVKKMIAGIRYEELSLTHSKDNPFILEPLPNVLFQRDPFATVGKEITLHHMWSETRNRETIFNDYVFKNHPRFKEEVTFLYNRNAEHSLEGGDILILNDETIIIGVSQRTSMEAVKEVANNLFKTNDSFKRVVALELPKSRSFMHLDTVFTNIDFDKFIVHPLIFENVEQFKIFEITREKTVEIKKELVDYLSELRGTKVQLITCGDNEISAAREQWNDGTNVLAIAPGEVIAYNRNPATIKKLIAAGVKVHTFHSSELSRGRGGPRCMSMPIYRELLKK